MMTHTLLLDPESGSTQEAFHASLAPDLADQLDQVMQCDRAFFHQHPDLDYYVRPITPVEVMEGQALGKEVMTMHGCWREKLFQGAVSG
jgi:hypothetical protein